MMSETIKRYYRKHVDLFNLIDKIKLWPSTQGVLHGVRTFTVKGGFAQVTTHCGEQFVIKRSRNSRASRWLRNKWYRGVCSKCKVPVWKIEKYSSTCFSQHHGSDLKHRQQQSINQSEVVNNG
jgi:pyrrolysyl-tRNA synthetase-like protein